MKSNQLISPQDLEQVIAAYEEQEEEQASELQQLHYKLNTSLLSGGADTSNIEFTALGNATASMQVKPVSETNNGKKRVVSSKI